MEIEQVLEDPILRDWINPHYLNKEIIEGLLDLFTSNTPFPHLELPEFIIPEKLEQVIERLTDQDFFGKESDLFQLSQTVDFDDLEDPILKEFKDLYRSDTFLSLMSLLTNIALSRDVDMLGNIYQDTDYLLCHDDQLSQRKIAYILYLTDLDDGDGGLLNLFNTLHGKPHKIVKRLIPRYNQFTFFLVTPISFHEVAEIVNEETYRVSISGWFNND